MASHRRSYWKTIVAAALLGTCVLAVLTGLVVFAGNSSRWPIVARLAWPVAACIAAAAVVWMGLVVTGGVIALRRDTLEERGLPYAATRPRERIAGSGVLAVRHAMRWIKSTLVGRSDGLDLRPGDLVEVKSLEEILATLDDRGRLDEMPFMPEMAAYCGRRWTVFRRVEKMNDWVHRTGLRRVHRTVLLDGVRCDGTAHGGCQTNCHVRWKDAWLRPVSAGRSTEVPHRSGSTDLNHVLHQTELSRLTTLTEEPGERRYVCQTTELTAGTSPLSSVDPRHYLRDLLLGNVRFEPFVIGVALDCFNWIQRKRRGAGFPYYGSTAQNPTLQAPLGLQPGDLVRVKSKREIESTLDLQSRCRGLWFDAEMLRFCGGQYLVKRRIERLIVERTGKLIELRTPCIALEGVTATGEYRAFNPEDELIFWREAWLERVAAATESHASELQSTKGPRRRTSQRST